MSLHCLLIVMRPGIPQALAAAALFGASTPFSKLLMGDLSPIMLAGILYGGSAAGLLAWLLVRRRMASGQAHLTKADWPWLATGTLFGGVLAPLALMYGLAITPASSAALLLNIEGVFTALLAWFVFRENFDARIAAGMVCIVAGGAVLSWQGDGGHGVSWGALLVVLACLGWAVDNNLTRRIAAADAVTIVTAKSVVGALVNIPLALAIDGRVPPLASLAGAAIVGLLGYGVSIVFFVVALRNLGTARTGAYFSTSPFVGATIALLLLRESPGLAFWSAAALMSVGVWLHLTEHHEHEHTHERLEHTHEHVHDEHHRHDHASAWDGREPHTHPHVHEPLTHIHPHVPDIHHRHDHQ